LTAKVLKRALSNIAREAHALEQTRVKILAQRKKGSHILLLGGVVALIAGLGIISVAESGWAIIALVVVCVIGALVISYHYFSKGAAAFRHLFKHQFMTRYVREFFPELTYKPNAGIPSHAFDRSGLYRTRPDRYSAEDLFEGRLGETKLAFSEVHAEEKRRTTDSKGRSKTTWHTIFEGLFFIADFNKDFRSPVSVMPDVAEKHFGWIGKKLQKLGGSLQTMENPEFEKLFVVRGQDAVETRYILTPAMQDSLVRLRKRTGPGLRIIFRDSRLWIAIPNREDWFEPNLHCAVGDLSQLKRLLMQMTCCTSIVDELDLNTRIWTK